MFRKKEQKKSNDESCGYIRFAKEICEEIECPDCRGTGYDPWDGGQCERCAGTGTISREPGY